MEHTGPVSAAGIPPPAPPPPPASFSAPKTLGIGRRSPANRDHFGSLSAPNKTERPLPFAGVHPETLLNAAKRLRPTQHRQPLLSSEREQFLDGQDQLVVGRYWPNQPEYAPLAFDQTGTKVHAAPDDSSKFAAFSVDVGYSPSLSPASIPSQHQQQQQSSPSPNPTFGTNGSITSSVPSRQIPIQLVGPFPGQTFAPGPVPPPSFSSTSSSTSSVNAQHSNNLITDPQRYIHAYATQTPVASIIDEAGAANPMRMNNGTVAMAAMAGPPPGKGRTTDNFVRELRDQGLSERQRAANQQKSPQYRTIAQPPSSLQNYAYKQTFSSSSTNTSQPNAQIHQTSQSSINNSTDQQVDQLIREMELKMRTAGYGTAPGQDFCTKCKQNITGDPPGVTALGQAYHVTCFCCDQCQKQLAGCSFYAVDGKNLCQVDYMNSLEKCDKCKMPITQKILRALGKAFHPECFSCPACLKSLDGIPFTVDKENCAYCLDCYHERFSPRCAACLKVIAPTGNETEVARVIAMDRSYHLDCYKCEDCGLKLNSKIEGQGCYPLESHLFCKNCNLKRLKSLK